MKTTLKVFGAFIGILIIVGVILALFITDEDTAELTPVSTEVAKTVDEDLTIPEQIEKIIIDELGKTNNMKKDTVNSIEYVESDKGVIVALNGSDNLGNNMIKKGMWKSSVEILKPISEINDLDTVILHWYFPLVDTHGNEKEQLVMAFEMNRETMDKINWDNFLRDNIPEVSENYFEHAVFKE